MNAETNIEARARKHAALGDPVRLRIADLLALGDLSPTELRDHLDVSSNLLAHHLNVLEHEEIIERGRSEGDGRRTYVTLMPDALVDLVPTTAVPARRIVFVCSANSARSQLAQVLWNDASRIPALSAGTHPADEVARGAAEVARRHGFTLAGVVPQQVEGLIESTDFVITVCDRAHEEFRGGSVHWSVPDPVRIGTDAAFEAAFTEIAARVSLLVPRLLPAAPDLGGLTHQAANRGIGRYASAPMTSRSNSSTPERSYAASGK